MKVTVLELPGVTTELVVRCPNAKAPEIQELLQAAACMGRRIPARSEDEISFLQPSQIFYGEFVNRTVFLYTADAVYPTSLPLKELEELGGFLRCSKSMVVNLHRIARLKSGTAGRITATLQNGERILISRHYACALRSALSI